MNMRCLGALSGLGLLVLCTGCATPHRRAEIPRGEWSGSGTFVLEKWSSGDEEGASPLVTQEHGSYPTQLEIGPATVAGQDAIRLEILSQRGEVKELDGDRTHLVVHLIPRNRIADGAIALYHLAEMGISFDESEPRMGTGPDGPTHASCMVVDGDLVLRIHYMEGFVDTFRFRGDRLYKDGVCFPEDGDGLIHWSEVLRRRR